MKNFLRISIIGIITFFLYSFESPNADSIRIVKKGNNTFMYLSQNINFVLNETNIDDSCKRQLHLVVHYLKMNPNLKVEVGVHNDARTKNDLSQTRADNLKGFFEAYGVASTNVSAKGYHTSIMLNDCADKTKKCSEKEQNENRRVEIKILNPSVLKEYIVVSGNGQLAKN